MIRIIDSEAVITRSVAYRALMMAKEFADQERVNGNAMVTAGKTNPDRYRVFTQLIARQEEFFNEFNALAFDSRLAAKERPFCQPSRREDVGPGGGIDQRNRGADRKHLRPYAQSG